MKRGLIFIIFLLFLVSFSFVLADNGNGINDNNSKNINDQDNNNLSVNDLNNNINDTEDEKIEDKGIIKYVDVEGGCWKIESNDGLNYEPTNLDDKYKQDSLRVEFEGNIITDIASTCMVGTLIKITEIEIDNEEDEDNETEVEIEFEGKKIKIKEKYKTAIKTKNRLRFYSETGECPAGCECEEDEIECKFGNSKVECEFEDSEIECEFERKMTIHAGESGNTIIQIKGINASTKVELFKEGEIIYGMFKNNQTKSIILPDEVIEKIKQKIKAHMENSTLELDEEGEYQYEARKIAKFLGLFKVKEKVKMSIDAETGEIEKIRNSWWGWLARDISEEVEEKINETQ